MAVFRSMTLFFESNVDLDLRMLRSFRVLRPLKLVSRIPSKLVAASVSVPTLRQLFAPIDLVGCCLIIIIIIIIPCYYPYVGYLQLYT